MADRVREPEVSVLIPCYNAGRYIGETLESVFRQTWPNVEIVVVNDGSSDNSSDVIRRFRAANLTLVEQSNRGQTAALNACLAHAHGSYVQYLDADDLIGPDKIERQLTRLIGHPRAVASAEWGRFHLEPENTRFEPETVWRDLDPLEWLVQSLADGLGMMLPALWMIPMEIVRAVGPWNESLSLNNDAEYFTRVLLAADQVLFCAGARCYYRSGINGNLSGQKTAKAWASQLRVLELCEAYLRAREDSDRVRRCFALAWQHLAHSSYPYDCAIAEKAVACARRLHSVRIKPDGGGAFKIASRLVGWRIARRLQAASGRP